MASEVDDGAREYQLLKKLDGDGGGGIVAATKYFPLCDGLVIKNDECRRMVATNDCGRWGEGKAPTKGRCTSRNVVEMMQITAFAALLRWIYEC